MTMKGAGQQGSQSGDGQSIQFQQSAADLVRLCCGHLIDVRQHFLERCMRAIDQLILRQLAHTAVRTFQTEHETAFHLICRAIKLFAFDALLAEPPDFPADEIDDTVHLFRSGRRIDGYGPDIRIAREKGIDGVH